MIFGVIVAGGIGSRMGNKEKPKQYLTLGKKPIIIHTLDAFYKEKDLEKIIVLCPQDWVAYTEELVEQYFEKPERIVVLPGGSTRNETIMNAISYVEKQYGLNEDTIIVTHDSVRPFVTERMIRENISYARKYGSCTTAIAATDTILYSEDGTLIHDIPDRSKMYQTQTPQSFQALKLKQRYDSLTEDEKEILTDAAKIFVMKGEDVPLVKGEVSNIKITYPYDLIVAEAFLKEKES